MGRLELILLVVIAALLFARPTLRRLFAAVGRVPASTRWLILAGAAAVVVGYMLAARAADPMLRRNTSLENPKSGAMVFYWGTVVALLALAGWAVGRARPGLGERLRSRLNDTFAGPAQAGRRAVAAALAMYAAMLFACWAMFGHLVFPLAFGMAAVTAGAAAAAVARPPGSVAVVPPWSPDLSPAERRRNATVGLALLPLVALVALYLAADNWRHSPGPMLVLLVLVAGGVVWAARRLSRWDDPEGWANRDRLLDPDRVPPPPVVPPAAATSCPKCAAAVAADAPLGLCPKCLLQLALGSVADPHRTSPFAGPLTPPSPEEVQEFFPHLQVLGLIGAGGMGAVYKVRQPNLDRFAALKLIRPKADDPTFAERFAREARALARLGHPNIVTVYETGEAGGSLYLLMEFVDGVTLREPMRAKVLAPPQALSVVGQICTALQFAHEQGVVHRDIKPENILLDKHGKVKIADFGLAKVADAEAVSLTRTQQAMGTPHYMAPEQWERPQDVDHRADMYALGVVIYELLTGELPLGRFDPPSKKAAVTAGLDAVVFRLLDKEPGRRFQNASDLWTAVERAQAGEYVGPGGWAWRTKTTLLGWPLIHIRPGPPVGMGEPTKGWIAVGNAAVGLIAFGNLAVGGIAVGPAAVGLLSVGAFALGLLAAGGIAVGGLAAGGLAVGGLAVGGGAAGYAVYGGGAIGELRLWGSKAVSWADTPGHVVEFFEEAADPTAEHPNNPWRPHLFARWLFPYLGPTVVGMAILAAGLGVFTSRLRTAGRRRAALMVQGMGLGTLFLIGFLLGMFVLPFPLQLLLWLAYGPLLFGMIGWFNRELAAVTAGGA